MLWKMGCFTLRSMSCTNHTFPIYATRECSNAPEINCVNSSEGRVGGGGGGRLMNNFMVVHFLTK